MAELSRNDLKELFQTGYRPSEEDFANLIESLISTVDDGLKVSNQKLSVGGGLPSNTLDVRGKALIGEAKDELGNAYVVPANGLTVTGALAVARNNPSGKFSIDIGGNGRVNGMLRVGEEIDLQEGNNDNTRFRVKGSTHLIGEVKVGNQVVIDAAGNWVGPQAGIGGSDGQDGADGDSFFTENGATAYTTKKIALGTGITSADAALHLKADTSKGLLIESSNATAPAITIKNDAAVAVSDGVTLKLSDAGSLIVTNSKGALTGTLTLSPNGQLGLNGASDQELTLGGTAIKTQGSGTFLTPADDKVMSEEDADPFNGVDVTAILQSITLKQYKYNGKFSTDNTHTPILPDLSTWPAELAHLQKSVTAIIEGGSPATSVAAIDSGELIYYLIQSVRELSNRIKVLEDAAPQPGG